MRQPLSEGDLLSFSRLGIPAEILLAAGVCRVTGKEAHDTFGIRFTGDLSGIIFPYSDPTTGKRVSARLRRDNPEVDSDGKPRHKYICAWGDRRHLFFPPGVGGLLPDTSVPVVMVEAEKSALAIAAVTARTHRSLLSIGCGGCWGWRGKTGILTNGDGRHIDERGPLPDFSLVTWEGREVFVCFDSNSARNPKVRQARYALAQEIHGRGGRVRLVELPKLANVNGPDDYIGLSGDEAFLTLLGSTASLAHSALAEASKTLEELEVDTTPAKDPETACRLLQVVAGVENPDHRRVLEKRSAKVLHWSTSEVRSGVRARITERLESAAIAKEAARKAYLRSLKLDRSMLIRELEGFFEERAYLPANAALILAFFSLNTWVFDVFDSTPYLLLDSAVPGCGKNTVMNILEVLCACPKMLASASEAALFRMIDLCRPTVLLDEAELLAIPGERADYLRSIAHAGYKKGGTVPRCVGQTNELQNFSVYCPKVFAAIGGLTGALLDRCIVVHMEKAPSVHVRKSTRQRQLQRHSAPLREAVEAYAEQSRESLAVLYENEPDQGYWTQLRDREAELWGPLLMHARFIGPELEARLLATALSFSSAKLEIESQDRDAALSIELLHALTQITGERFAPVDLVPCLAGEAWGERFSRCRDERAKAATVGRFLSRFRLKSREHTRTGTSYLQQEAVEKLTAHIPGRTVTAVTSLPEQLEHVESKGPGDSVIAVRVGATSAIDDSERRSPTETLSKVVWSAQTLGSQE